MRKMSDLSSESKREMNPVRNVPKNLVRARLRRIPLNICLGIVITLVMLGAEQLFERTTVGKLWDAMMYCWAQARFLPDNKQLPVAVVDISRLDMESVTGRATPREQLEKLVESIVNQGASAIAIDIDFSPDANGWTARGGPQFFDHIRKYHVPVYVGINRTREEDPSEWLGSDEYSDLAANMLVPADDDRRMPLWLTKGPPGRCASLVSRVVEATPSQPVATSVERSTCLASLSVVLALARSNEKPFKTPWPPALFRWFDEITLGNTPEFSAAYFFPNYSVVPILRSQTSKAVVLGKEVALVLSPNLTSLRGKVVLLGSTSYESFDKFPVPPWEKDVPGVYLHASAAYTLISGPLFEVTEEARVLLDLFFAGSVLLGVSFLQLIYAARTQDELISYRAHLLFTGFAIAGVILFGYWLANRERILWTDWLLVTGVLLLHHVLHQPVEHCADWVFVEGRGMLRRWMFQADAEEK